MPGGDKSKYTGKQERKADHIAEGYEKRGVSEKEAQRRAWATVNKDDGGGKKTGGSDRGKHTGRPAAHKGGEKGGKAAASRSAAERSASAKKGQQRVSGMLSTQTRDDRGVEAIGIEHSGPNSSVITIRG